MVTFIQRFDSALRLSPHAHVLCLDGVYVRGVDGELGFHPLPEPTQADVARVAARTARRIERVLASLGRDADTAADADDELVLEHPALAGCYRAATGGRQLFSDPGARTVRLLGPAPEHRRTTSLPLVAEVGGVNVHAARVVDGRDRKQLERLCRYLARPPLSDERLSELPDGRLRLELKTPWSDGTTAIVLTPMDLIARLCALVPPPRMHLTRFHGVLAPAASLRSEVVPRPPPDPALDPPPAQLSLFDPTAHRPAPAPDQQPPPRRAGRHPWAWLLRRVFALDITVCPRCSGRMRITQLCFTADAIARVLAHHGLGPQPPPPPPKPTPGQLGLAGVAMH